MLTYDKIGVLVVDRESHNSCACNYYLEQKDYEKRQYKTPLSLDAVCLCFLDGLSCFLRLLLRLFIRLFIRLFVKVFRRFFNSSDFPSGSPLGSSYRLYCFFLFFSDFFVLLNCGRTSVQYGALGNAGRHTLLQISECGLLNKPGRDRSRALLNTLRRRHGLQ